MDNEITGMVENVDHKKTGPIDIDDYIEQDHQITSSSMPQHIMKSGDGKLMTGVVGHKQRPSHIRTDSTETSTTDLSTPGTSAVSSPLSATSASTSISTFELTETTNSIAEENVNDGGHYQSDNNIYDDDNNNDDDDKGCITTPGSFASNIFTLTKKKRNPRQSKLSASGILNPFNNPYGNVGVSSSDSEESSVSTDGDGTLSNESEENDVKNDDLNGNHDENDDESIMSDASQTNGYALPSALSPPTVSPDRKKFFNQNKNKAKKNDYNNNIDDNDDNSDDGDDDDDDLSQRTPIPKAPPFRIGDSILPSTFLRNRNNDSHKGGDNLSDISSEEDDSSVVQRQKREEQNVGRLVMAAKQQQSFAQAWFEAGNKSNALPEVIPKGKNKTGTVTTANGEKKSVRIPSNAPPGLKMATISIEQPAVSKKTGPIDLDSGEVWDGNNGDDDEEDGKTKKTGLFSAKTKRISNVGLIQFGVPDDEDLTHLTERKGLNKTVCTIGNTRCSLWAMLIISLGISLAVSGAAVASVYFSNSDEDRSPSIDLSLGDQTPSSSPSISYSPTTSKSPTGSPSPTFLNPFPLPSTSPTFSPSDIPTNSPSNSPTISLAPSATPSSTPSISLNPTISLAPSASPSIAPSISANPTISLAPTQVYRNTTFSQLGGDLIVGTDPVVDENGYSVSLSTEGDVLAVGARRFPNEYGSVKVYRKEQDGNRYKDMGQALTGLNQRNDFGRSVDLSGDGMILAVGECKHDNENGLVRVFSYSTSEDKWLPYGDAITGKEENALEDPKGEFGFAVSLSEDGRRLAVGAPEFTFNQGQVTIYEYDDSKGLWEQIGDKLNGDFLFDDFGYGVSLSGNGNIIACGSPKADGQNGKVHVYEWYDDGTEKKWVELEGSPLKPEIEFDFGLFGYSISLSHDGSRLAVGIPGSNFDNGKAVVYDYIDDNSWTPVGEELFGTNGLKQRFGSSVSLSREGTNLAIGAPRNSNLSEYRGQSVIYRWTGGSWGSGIVLDGNEEGEEFGHDVALSGDAHYLAVGGPNFVLRKNVGVARAYQWAE